MSFKEAHTSHRTMSIEQQQRNKPGTSTQAMGGPQLTAANLAAHNHNTSTMTTGQAVRSWLNDNEASHGRYVDSETWARLIERDTMAADIEAIVRGENQNGAGQR
jgi:hypothetical protein